MNEIEDAMVGQTDSKAVVVMFADDSYGDNNHVLTQAQAAWLRDRIDEELALLDGGTVTPETPGTDEIDVDGHPPSEMMGSPEYHTRQSEGEAEDERGGQSDASDDSADEVTTDPAKRRSRDLDELVAVDQVGEKMVGRLREEGFETLGGVFDASIAEVAQTIGIGNGTASRIHDYCADVINESPDADTADVGGDDGPDEDSANNEGGSRGDDVKPLPAGEIESALVEYDVDHEVAVSDVIQAVDEYSACFRVGRMLGIDRPTAEVLLGQLDLKPALERDDGLAARRVQLADGGEPA
jgi:hypothetical protein